MGTIYICSSKTATPSYSADATDGALSSFFAKDVFLWWDKALLEDEQNYCLETWCQNNAIVLRHELAQLLTRLGQIYIHDIPLQHWLRVEEGPSPWHTSLLFEKHPKMLPMLFTMCKIKALESILRQLPKKFTHIVVHVDDDILQEHMRIYCQNNGLQYSQSLPRKKRIVFKLSSFSWAKIYFSLPHFGQACLRFAHWLYNMRRLLFGKKKPIHITAHKHATLVSYFPNIHKTEAEKSIFRSHYWENLHDILQHPIQEKQWHVHHLFIRVNSAQYTLKECIALKERFQEQAQKEQRSETFYYVEEFLTAKHIIKALREFLSIRKKAHRAMKMMLPHWRWENGQFSLWPYIQPAWKASFGGWRCLERCLQKQAFKAFAEFLHAHTEHTPQALHAWTLYPWENCPWERMLCHSMRTLFPQSTLYATQHSCVRQNDFRYFDGQDFFALAQHDPHVAHSLPHAYVLNGMHAVQHLQKELHQEKIRLGEALRYTYLTKMRPLPKTINTIQHLVLITSYFPQEVDAQIQILAQWWKQDASSPTFKGQVHIKAHPHLCIKPFLQKYELNIHDFHFFSENMPAIWDKVHFWHKKNESCLFWLANSTTVTLEAAYAGVSLCVQEAQQDFNLCPLHGCANLRYIRSAKDISKALADAPTITMSEKYFLLKPSLCQWKRLLGIA